MIRENGVNLSSFAQTTAADGITSYADGLYDTTQKKFQSAINADLYSKVGTTVTWDNLTGKPTFSTVATSGSFNDLTNKPVDITRSGVTTQTGLDINGKVNKKITIATISANANLNTVVNPLIAGQEYQIFVNNTDTNDHTITLNFNGKMVVMSANTITCKAGGWCEINMIANGDSSKYFVRGASSI